MLQKACHLQTTNQIMCYFTRHVLYDICANQSLLHYTSVPQVFGCVVPPDSEFFLFKHTVL